MSQARSRRRKRRRQREKRATRKAVRRALDGLARYGEKASGLSLREALTAAQPGDMVFIAPSPGDIYYDTTDNVFRAYNDANWEDVSGT